jgi:hypothetical protein
MDVLLAYNFIWAKKQALFLRQRIEPRSPLTYMIFQKTRDKFSL